MLFDLTEEQADFRDVVRSLLRKEFSVKLLRACWEDDDLLLGPSWVRLAELGTIGMTVPEADGGIGASHVELGLALEEAGYAGFPFPLMETAGVAAPLLAKFAPREMREVWLPRIIQGDVIISLALEGSNFVTWGQQSAAVITARGDELHLVPAASIQWRRLEAEDPTRQLARAVFDGLDATTLVVESPSAVAHAHDLATAGTASQLVGIAQRMLDIARAYSLERQQFGQQIGSFQALKHQMADIAVAIESARGLTWYAAYAASHQPENARDAARTAKAAASAAAYASGRGALQILGGIGFTWEHDLHFWLKRGRALEAAYGNTSDQRVALGRAVLAASASK